MSDSAEPKKAKGKGMKMILILGVVALLGGAGAAGGLYAAGAFSHEETGPKEDPNKPVLVLKGEDPEEIAKAHAAPAESKGEDGDSVAASAHGAAPGLGHGKGAGKGIDLPTPADPSKYQATYFQVQMPFTSNMADSDAFAQISIAVSTYYDARVVEAMTTHEMAIRSEVLLMLAQQEQMALITPQGKAQLQKKLKSLINDVLKQKTGYGGIDNVYFTNFVIQ
ncbi:flagellar basal body-associated FliL family protein [Sphingobium algorifonticola]|uniref:Flagellar protein FliL n=1 Tax=Sphingobium algorifonticola TaxID=2008318 RepID=A0A437JC45_9SPHN|nr:flagellar basal body-associated FliL family protein [Sphingobium algorifonticola]RVT43333.1 flagellar basal body-associated FliL family protein [Sphingobium algorifonticola]